MRKLSDEGLARGLPESRDGEKKLLLSVQLGVLGGEFVDMFSEVSDLFFLHLDTPFQ